jgi:hypothetical protein
MIAAPISLFLFGGMIENDIMTTVLVGIGFLFIIGFLIILYGMVKPEK